MVLYDEDDAAVDYCYMTLYYLLHVFVFCYVVVYVCDAINKKQISLINKSGR